jgi:uncharacterized NAD(P)/FAD-binding protein YdhS
MERAGTSKHARQSVEPVNPRQRCAIVIVGGGFAGAALAYHLLQHTDRELHVTVIERGARLGRGIAYGVDHDALRLNVPAARMSIDPKQPDDFVTFARCEDTPQAFLARARYGAYVDERLADAQRRNPGRLRKVRGEAVSIDARGVRLADGRRVSGDRIVIATGLTARTNVCRLPDDPRILDAWDAGLLERLPKTGRILLLGAGLSAVDVLGLLDAADNRADVLVLSRHGLLPRPHAPRSAIYKIPARLGAAPDTLRELVRWVRRVAHEAVRAGYCWQHAIDALRPQLSTLWQSLSARDRSRFVRLLRPYWEVLRHRVPIDALDRIEARRTRGELDVCAGQVIDCKAERDALEITLSTRAGQTRVESFTAVVRCLGPALEVDAASMPLMAALLRHGLARLDHAGLGIETTDQGRVIDGDGVASQRVFALGQPCLASRWETTSVPEIARDAAALAALFAGEVTRRTTSRIGLAPVERSAAHGVRSAAD